jgi:hypothetical protein
MYKVSKALVRREARFERKFARKDAGPKRDAIRFG